MVTFSLECRVRTEFISWRHDTRIVFSDEPSKVYVMGACSSPEINYHERQVAREMCDMTPEQREAKVKSYSREGWIEA